jgi:hypothetical protein
MDTKTIAVIAVAAGLGAVIGESVSRGVVKATGATGSAATFVKAATHAATVVGIAFMLRKHVPVFG